MIARISADTINLLDTEAEALVRAESSSHAAFPWKWDVFLEEKLFWFDCVWVVRSLNPVLALCCSDPKKVRNSKMPS